MYQTENGKMIPNPIPKTPHFTTIVKLMLRATGDSKELQPLWLGKYKHFISIHKVKVIRENPDFSFPPRFVRERTLFRNKKDGHFHDRLISPIISPLWA